YPLSPVSSPDLTSLLPPSWNPPVLENPGYAPTPLPLVSDAETINFLLIGSDRRSYGSSFRTDTLIVAALRAGSAQVTLISIPRDLYVYIPTWGMDRVNTAYLRGQLTGYPGGGQALLKDTILYNLGIRIDHLAMVEFDGFRQIVDTLGGVDVPVACPYTDWHIINPNLSPYYESNWQLITISPGLIHMDGDLALWYARSRLKSNDYDRGRRQQEVLRAIYERALSGGTLTRIPELYADFQSAVTTDLGLGDLLQLALLAPRLTNADIRSYYINRSLVIPWTTPQGGAVLLPDGAAIQTMLQEALASAPPQAEIAVALIEVQNGSPYDGWDALAASRLNYAGYETRLVAADRRDYSQSLLYDFTPAQDAGRSASLLAILGLPPYSLIPAPDAGSAVSYRLLLGSDYQPCFNPASMSR
ncbi:MAG: LCP family protein, partial [Chloroflexi bacterium]|nr:LCP family protein [Chloroflexota bacterium]